MGSEGPERGSSEAQLLLAAVPADAVYFSTGLAQVHGRIALMDTFMLAVAIGVGIVVICAVLIYFIGIVDWLNRGSH